MTVSEPSSLELRDVDITIDQQEILRNISLSVLPGEMFALLGGAESGKSTLLRAIAGLDRLSRGEVWIDAENITHTAPHRRGVPLMLQAFPLWPHMTVGRNVAFGLQRQRLSRRKIRERVARELACVGLSNFRKHLPWQLTPSQQQRVALARTLIGAARIDLLDEPFSAQDEKLREKLLRLLKRRQQQSALTTVITTQDPIQALRFADRIAVLHEGELQQVGTPVELYDMPANRFVAEYLGGINLIDGEIEYAGDQPLFRAENGIVIPLFDHPVKRARTGSAMFRPQDLRIVGRNAEPFGDQIRFSGRIERTEFLGSSLRHWIDLSGKAICLDLPRDATRNTLHIGDQVVIGLDPAKIRILER
ncbi:MAG: ABC transporter ATP-binding protein [Chromatiaceae bacterium]|jgi:ABC-type Fe3+/spermidine/putrescine transport system ATPase subunit